MIDEHEKAHGVWWHKVIGVAAVGLATSVGGAITSHFGAPTTAQFKALKDDVTAVVASQQTDRAVAAKQHEETNGRLDALGAKVDEVRAAVTKKKKRSNAEP